MSYFKAKMHQIQFRLGLCPRPRWGSLSAPPDSLAAIGGSTSKGRKEREGKGREGREEGKGGVEKEGRGGGEGSPHLLLTTLTTGHRSV